MNKIFVPEYCLAFIPENPEWGMLNSNFIKITDYTNPSVTKYGNEEIYIYEAFSGGELSAAF